jgi:hypothetical protein
MKNLLKITAACLLLSSCQHPELKAPIVNECRVYSDSEDCICFNSKGEEYRRACWGNLVIDPAKQQQIEEWNNEVSKCLFKCTKNDCSKQDRRNACPNVFRN